MRATTATGFGRVRLGLVHRVSAGVLAVAGALLWPGEAFAGGGQPTLLAWNNLGMHCMDDDYSVFSILPPFNTFDAQLIEANGNLVTTTSSYTLTYEPVADAHGSINSTAVGRSNFWTYAPDLFGATLAPDMGLAGFAMPGTGGSPQAMAFDPGQTWFEATGVPITPWDDAGRYNAYPVMKIVARDGSGQVIAQVTPVLPVSEEMDCRKCHGSDAGAAARPTAGWVNDPVPTRDYRLNILRLHDEHNLGKALYTAALAAKGYSADGLYAHVTSTGKPVLCAACHASEALPGNGYAGVPALTQAVHGRHANVTAPDTGQILNASSNRSACYQCHPGSATRCLRGAMGSAVAADGSAAMQCQSCHGTMSQVADPLRVGWLDEPNCQACHTGTATSNSGQIRYTSARLADGSLRVPANTTFATNSNTPDAGHSLYRFSRGHGGVACAACHGSTHAEYPGSHANDNLVSTQVQGHAGVIADCTACHVSMPSTEVGGPHGMHPVGQGWVSGHQSAAERRDCRPCHGADYRGTVLSRAFADRTLSARGTRTFFRGQQIGCYDCHNGAGGSGTAPSAPTVPATLALGSTSRTVPVSANVTISPATGTTLRIVRQPEHGSVAVSGNQVTYQPDAGYVGADTFTYAASNGLRESSLGTASVTVALGSPSATPQGDGFSNQIKYVLGLDPTKPAGSADLPLVKREAIGGGLYMTLTASLNPLAADEIVQVEGSNDGAVWVPLTDAGLVLADQPWLLKVRDSVDVAGGGVRFLRLVSAGSATPGGLVPRLANLSTRAQVMGGDTLAIAGFIMEGTGSKSLLVRAVGPKLAEFGVSNALSDPMLRLVRINPDGSSTDVDSNDDWVSSPVAASIVSVGQTMGAFSLEGASPGVNDTKSAALLVDLPAGQYTALASGQGAGEGVALVELYDADPSTNPTVRLTNLSTRAYVGNGSSILIGGLIVNGTQARTYLLRGVGPTLANFSLTGVLPDPRIDVYRRIGDNEEVLLSNDDWGDNANADEIAATAAALYAFPLASGSKDAAMLVTLAPGVYTVHVSGVNDTTGIAIVEIYAVP